MMTAGRPEAYAKAGGVLEAMAAKVYRLGDRAGNGSKVKIITRRPPAMAARTTRR